MSGYTQALFSKKKSHPKTVLGFYAIILGIGLSATTAMVGILAKIGIMTWLIPWILVFAAGLLFLMFVGVFAVSLFDPSKLMLTEVSGTEYIAIQQGVVLGDSTTGVRVVSERFEGATSIALDAPQAPEGSGTVEMEERNG